MTHTYLTVVLLFAPAFMFNQILNCFVRNDGSPQLAMTAMLIGCSSNIVLDYLFVMVFYMGMIGAVMATAAAPIIGITVLSRHKYCHKNQFHLIRTPFCRSLAKDAVSLGIPSFVSELSTGVVIASFNFIIYRIIGNVGIAAYGVIANLSIVVVSIYTGIGQGVQPLLSHAFGTDDHRQIKQLFRYAYSSVALWSVLLYGCIFLFADPITCIFNHEGNMQLQEIAVAGLKIYFSAALFVGLNIVCSMSFAAIQQAIPAQIISIMRGLIVIIPMAFVLSALWGMTGVWLSFPATEGIVVLLSMMFYRHICRKHL